MANIKKIAKREGYLALNNAKALETLEQIGVDNGLVFFFRDGEIITFPDEKDAYVLSLKYKDFPYISGVAVSDIMGQVEIPISQFRRVPADIDQPVLYDEDNKLGEYLARRGMSDLSRYRHLLGKKVKVTKVTMRFPQFEDDPDNPGKRRIKPDSYDMRPCYKFEELT